MKFIATPKDLFKEICQCLEVDLVQCRSADRHEEFKIVRHYYSYIGHLYYGFTFMELGGYLGHRDHTSTRNGKIIIQNGVETENHVILGQIKKIKSFLEIESNDVELVNILRERNRHLKTRNLELSKFLDASRRKAEKLTRENIKLQMQLNSKLETA